MAADVKGFMVKHQAAHGKELLKPKHHWLMDIPDQILRSQLVLDAFVVERQHLLVRRIADHCDNLTAFEESVMASVANVQLREAQEMVIGDRLLGPTAALAEMPHVLVARQLTIFHCTIGVDEIVFRGSSAGVVRACALEDSVLFLFVAEMAREREVAPRAIEFRRTSSLVVWRASEVRQCTAWREEPNGVVVALGA